MELSTLVLRKRHHRRTTIERKPGILLPRGVRASAATPSGAGYWLVATDGGIFAFGNAPFYGSTESIHLNKPVNGMAATHVGLGY